MCVCRGESVGHPKYGIKYSLSWSRQKQLHVACVLDAMKVRMLKSLTFSAHLTPFQYFVFDHSFPYTMSEAQYDRRDALTRQEMERKSEGITGAGDSRISEPPSSFSQLSSLRWQACTHATCSSSLLPLAESMNLSVSSEEIAAEDNKGGTLLFDHLLPHTLIFSFFAAILEAERASLNYDVRDVDDDGDSLY